MTGRTLGRYDVLEEISRGGMGVVYRGRDTRLNRDVALKVLPPDLVADPARRARFVQEAQAASALEHPHIAVIYEIDEIDGISVIAMELLRGDKLSDLTARGALSPGRALDLAVEIAEGLAKAHDKGIVHRDLKPSNVMLTEDGHAKIIDFGLAKLVDALSGDSGGVTALRPETDPGVVVGTAAYMSPEQATGGKVDHRSDVFSFGVVVYEMLTGRPPFRGKTGVDTMHAILHDPPPPLPPLGAADASHEITRILEKCLAKEPSERYQGMRDIVVDLRGARRRLESSSGTHAARTAVPAGERRLSTTREGVMKAQQWVYAGVAAVVVALVAIGALKSRLTKSESTSPPSGAAAQKPSVAVLYFENNTGNPQLDWLRTGLTDMLVTDLSQSPDVEVLPTDRLVQILTDMHRQDDKQISFDTVQEVAKRAGVKTVLVGSYVKAGDTIRINTRLQEAGTGKIVTSERVEAIGESNLFPMVDDLTKRIKAKFALPGSSDPTKGLLTQPVVVSSTPNAVVDRDLKDVTTASVEAYRYYAEGINLHERARPLEALPLLEKAVEVDPSFAMAYAKLAVIHFNLGHPALEQQYAAKAFQYVDRLTTRERYYIEGLYYESLPGAESHRKALAAYGKAIELYPDHASARNNLALNYYQDERYADAIREYEELRRRGMTFFGTYQTLANAYASLGDSTRALNVVQEYVNRNAEVAAGHTALGIILTRAGRLDDALAAFAKAETLQPADFGPLNGRRNIYALQERWGDVGAIVAKLSQSTDPTRRFQADQGKAIERLYHGRTAEALAAYESAAGERGGPRGAARNAIANLLLDRGQPALAATEAQRAFDETRGNGGLALTTLALAQMGSNKPADAANTNRLLVQQLTEAGTAPAQRQIHLAAGRLALEGHDAARAIQELTQAERLLPPNPTPGPAAAGPGIAVWFALGSAYLAAGSDADAAARFQKVIDAGVARVGAPMPYVRSWYFLGQISERSGDRAKAADFYRRFVGYWGDGDIDRDRVADARRKLAAS